MKVVFAGTPEFALSSLQALLDHPACDVVAVYTQPDRPAGRGKKLQASPVKQLALCHGIEVRQPQRLSGTEVIAALAALAPDLMVVTAYGLLLPQAVLDIPRLGCCNVHASLLPRWRGAAPIQRAIEAGDDTTGVTLMRMEAGLDTGPMLARRRVAIVHSDTAGSLHDKLADAGGQLLAETLQALFDNQIDAIEQDDSGVSYAHKLERAESACDWSQSASMLDCKIRAFNPWPTLTTMLADMPIKLLLSATTATTALPSGSVPGQIMAADKQGISVATGEGVLIIKRLQKSGGKPMDVQSFLNGVQITPGDKFSEQRT